MFKYIVKRLLLSILILFGVSVIIYFLIRLMPSDYFEKQFSSQLASGAINMDDIIEIKKLYGLDDDSFMGIVKGYFSWLFKALSGDLGESFIYKRPVAEVISDKMWISFAISGIALIFEFIIAIPLGVSSAVKQYSIQDYLVTILVMVGISFPSFFFANILIKIFAVNLGWLPVSGQTDATIDASTISTFQYLFGNFKHLILPMVTLVVLSIGGMMRYTRTNTLEVLNADYIRTARAKGLSERKVIYKHAFRNTMIPLVTTFAGILPSLFGGAMIVEQVFGIEGIGNIAYNALKQGDIPFIMGYNMFLAILTIVGTLFSDIMYAVVDPRVKLGK
ncbi:MAG: ABC transporter permease [Erysipelotrichaceae bacterium]|nr:ABC transporter permease [Erysipelotrichaceae bacterium]